MEYVFKGEKMINQVSTLEVQEIEQVSKKLRGQILKMIHNSQSGHPGGSLSCIDILNVLFTKCMTHYPEWIKQEVIDRIATGESQYQLSRELGISRYSIQSWCGLRPETKLRQLAPLAKGRPKRNKTIEDYEKENKRLRMEVSLMRDFLQSTERK